MTPNARNRHVVVQNIERTDMSVVDQLAPIGTATVHEAIGRRGYLGHEIQPIQHGIKVAGNAVTVLSHPGDNIMIHAAITICKPGDLLVVAVTAPSTHGMFGDLLGTSLMAHGVRGLVMDAAVRDTADLREMGFPVWSRHVSIQGTVKATPGSVNVPIVIGGTIINPGDVVCGDDDGVVVVGREEAAWGLEKSNDRLANEEGTRAKLAASELSFDFYNMRPKLDEWGVDFV